MNYELAKRLKDAGFPFEECSLTDCSYVGPSLDGDNGKNYHYPTLEELIEACGDEFDFLHMTPTRGSWACHSQSNEAFGAGSTPTEAVARLWLALNKTI